MISIRSFTRWAALAGLSILAHASCVSEPCACSEPSRSVILFGEITDSAGPVLDAVTLESVIRFPTCSDVPRGVSESVEATAGTYELTVYLFQTRPHCLDVVAVRPGTGDTTVVTGVSAQGSFDPPRIRVDLSF